MEEENALEEFSEFHKQGRPRKQAGIYTGATESPKHARIFEMWYANGRNVRRTCEETGISHMPVRRMIEKFKWNERADERDEQLRKYAEAESLKEQTGLFARHKEARRKLLDRGLEYLESYEITNARDAINAIKLAIMLDRTAEGLPNWIQQVAHASDDELYKRQQEILDSIKQQGALGDPGRVEEERPSGATDGTDGGGEGIIEAEFTTADRSDGLRDVPDGSSGVHSEGTALVPLVDAA